MRVGEIREKSKGIQQYITVLTCLEEPYGRFQRPYRSEIHEGEGSAREVRKVCPG